MSRRSTCFEVSGEQYRFGRSRHGLRPRRKPAIERRSRVSRLLRGRSPGPTYLLRCLGSPPMVRRMPETARGPWELPPTSANLASRSRRPGRRHRDDPERGGASVRYGSRRPKRHARELPTLRGRCRRDAESLDTRHSGPRSPFSHPIRIRAPANSHGTLSSRRGAATFTRCEYRRSYWRQDGSRQCGTT